MTKFGMVMHLGPSDPVSQYTLATSKIQDGSEQLSCIWKKTHALSYTFKPGTNRFKCDSVCALCYNLAIF